MQGNLKDAIESASLLEVKFESFMPRNPYNYFHSFSVSEDFLAGDRRQEREIQSNLHYKETWGEEFPGKVAMADTLSALLESILACN